MTPPAHAPARRAAVLAAVAGLACALAPSAHAQTTRTFDNEAGDFDWYNPSNWDPDGTPGPTDILIIDAASSVIVTNPVNNDVTVGRLMCSSGLSKVNGNFTFNGPSEIVDFIHQSCCTDQILANSTLRLEDPLFFSRVSFEGAGPITLAGNAQVNGSPIIRGATEVIVTGDTLAPNGFSMADSSRLTITGDLLLPRGGSIAPLGPQLGQVIQLVGGEIGFLDTLSTTVREVTVSIDMITQGGTISADDGLFRLTSGFYRVRNATVDVRNLGFVDFAGGALSTEFESVTFQGLGEVTIDTNATFTGASTNTIDDNGVDLSLFLAGNTITFEGTLESTGRIIAATNRFEGPGRLIISGGTYDQRLTTINNSTVEFAGGLAEIRALHRIDNETIISGGTVSIETGGGNIQTQPGGVLTINSGTLRASESLDPGQTVSATGLVNMSGGELTVDEGTLAIRAGNNSVFENAAFRVSPTQGEFGTLRLFALTGDDVFLGDLDVTGNGRFELGASGSGNAGSFTVDGTVTTNVGNPLASITAGTQIRRRVQGPGGIDNDGVLYIDSQAELAVSVLNRGRTDFDGFNAKVEAVFNNITGTVIHSRNIRAEPGAFIDNNSDWIVTDTASILGSGGIVINRGTWELQGVPGVKVVNQTIVTQFSNDGTVKVSNGTLTLNNCLNVIGGVLIGGTWETTNNGRIAFPTDVTVLEGGGTVVKGGTDAFTDLRDLEHVRDGATLEVPENDAFNADRPITVDDAQINVEPGAELNVPSDLELKNGSTLRLKPGAEVQALEEIILQPPPPNLPSVIDDITGVVDLARPAGGRAALPAFISAFSIDLNGRLIPGGDGFAHGSVAAGVGAFQIDAQVNAFPTAQWLFDVATMTDADVININGSALLGGTLIINTPPGFEPAPGAQVTLIDATGSLTGDFDSVQINGPGAGQLEVVVTASQVILRQACAADLDGSGEIDLADLLAVLAAFGTSDAGDVNGDNQTDLADLLTVLAAFGEPCPDAAS